MAKVKREKSLRFTEFLPNVAGYHLRLNIFASTVWKV